MKDLIVLEGPAFDWESTQPAWDALAESEGQSMGAAMMADPGCAKCPECEEFFWATGEGFVGCPECGAVWDRARRRCVHCCRPMWLGRQACPMRDDPGGSCVERRSGG